MLVSEPLKITDQNPYGLGTVLLTYAAERPNLPTRKVSRDGRAPSSSRRRQVWKRKVCKSDSAEELEEPVGKRQMLMEVSGLWIAFGSWFLGI